MKSHWDQVFCLEQTGIWLIPVKLAKIFCILYLLGLYRIPVYPGFGLDRFIQDSSLSRVRVRQVYTGFQFIQGLVQTGLYRIPVYPGFSLDRFIQDSSLSRVRFRQVYTGFRLDRFIQDSSLSRVRVRQVFTIYCNNGVSGFL